MATGSPPVSSGTTSTALGSGLFDVIRDVAGMGFKWDLTKREMKAGYAPTAVSAGPYTPDYGPPMPTRKPINYQAWGLAVAAVGVVLGFVALVSSK